MKNRNIAGNPISIREEGQLANSHHEECQLANSPCEESQLEEYDIPPFDEPRVEAINDSELIEPYENVGSKRFKKSTVTTDPVLRKFIEDSDKRAKKRDELRQNLVAQTKK